VVELWDSLVHRCLPDGPSHALGLVRGTRDALRSIIYVSPVIRDRSWNARNMGAAGFRQMALR
jgi:hypothetical protein